MPEPTDTQIAQAVADYMQAHPPNLAAVMVTSGDEPRPPSPAAIFVDARPQGSQRPQHAGPDDLWVSAGSYRG